jgi:hypothetical protein
MSSKYTALLVAGNTLVAGNDDRRDYKDRQRFANEQGADLYIELHFNASAYDKPGTQDNPASVLVADNASLTSKSIANRLAFVVSEALGYPNRGVDILPRDRRGYWNLYYTNMPAVLTELLYVSDKEQAEFAMSKAGQRELAAMHFEVIKEHFPAGAKVAISIGHKYKVGQPHDRGAPLNSEVDNPKGMAEADCAEAVAWELIRLFETYKEGEESEVEDETEPRSILLKGQWLVEAVPDGIELTKV